MLHAYVLRIEKVQRQLTKTTHHSLCTILRNLFYIYLVSRCILKTACSYGVHQTILVHVFVSKSKVHVCSVCWVYHLSWSWLQIVPHEIVQLYCYSLQHGSCDHIFVLIVFIASHAWNNFIFQRLWCTKVVTWPLVKIQWYNYDTSLNEIFCFSNILFDA